MNPKMNIGIYTSKTKTPEPKKGQHSSASKIIFLHCIIPSLPPSFKHLFPMKFHPLLRPSSPIVLHIHQLLSFDDNTKYQVE